MRETGGEHQTVVRQRRERHTKSPGSGFERGDDDRAGHPRVAGDAEGVAGVVVEPGEDLGVGAVGESPVGEIGLPGFVWLFGLEPDV